MNFTLSSDFSCNGHAFHQGEVIDLIPTDSSKLVLKKNGHELLVGPIIFKFLNEVEEPTVNVLELWLNSQICESPTGHALKLDGTGPDGFHSWFRYLDYL